MNRSRRIIWWVGVIVFAFTGIALAEEDAADEYEEMLPVTQMPAMQQQMFMQALMMERIQRLYQMQCQNPYSRYYLPPEERPEPIPFPYQADPLEPIINKGTDKDDTQIDLGTPEPDVILQLGKGGNDTQYISGAASNDWLGQDGGAGNDLQFGYGDDGNDWIYQNGGAGNDKITASGGAGNDYIDQIAGAGDDTLQIGAGDGDDLVRANAGAGKDTLTYDVTAGKDQVFLTLERDARYARAPQCSMA